MKKMMLLAVAAMMAFGADAETVKYFDPAEGVTKETECTGIDPLVASLGTGWYVVSGNLTQSGTLSFSGEVNLVLSDGAKLTVNGGISSDAGNLTVWGQAQGTGELIAMGKAGSVGGGLVVVPGGSGETDVSAGTAIACGSLTIHGGRVTATGGAGGDASNVFTTLSQNGGGGGAGVVASVSIDGGVLKAFGGNGGRVTGLMQPMGQYPIFTGDGGPGGPAIVGTTAYAGGGLACTGGAGGGSDSGVTGANGAAFTVQPSARNFEYVKYGDSAARATVIGGESALPQDLTKCRYVEIATAAFVPFPPEHVDSSYVDSDGTVRSKNCVSLACADDLADGLGTDWFVVSKDFTCDTALNVSGDANLVLADGKTMTLMAGVSGTGTLTVWGQSAQSGKLRVWGSKGATVTEGLASVEGEPGGSAFGVARLVICGGSVEATGGDGGDGYYYPYSGYQICVNGGVGGNAVSCPVTVRRGELTACGGSGGIGYNNISMQGSREAAANGRAFAEASEFGSEFFPVMVGDSADVATAWDRATALTEYRFVRVVGEPVDQGSVSWHPWTVGTPTADAVTAYVENGVLLIAGTGRMADWTDGVAPWAGNGDIVEVRMDAGVENFGKGALDGLPGLKSINGLSLSAFASVIPIGETCGAQAESLAVENGVVRLGVTVLTNGDLSAETESWGAAKLDPATVEQAEDGKGLVVTVPVSTDSGFMILRSKAAK